MERAFGSPQSLGSVRDPDVGPVVDWSYVTKHVHPAAFDDLERDRPVDEPRLRRTPVTGDQETLALMRHVSVRLIGSRRRYRSRTNDLRQELQDARRSRA